MKNLIIFTVLTISASTAFGQNDYFWKNKLGNRIPETESRRSVENFGGSLLVTSDTDWKEKWDTPSETVPNFNEAKIIPRGKKVFVLIFFANAKLSNYGNANVSCDLEMVSPDGTKSLNQHNAVCYQGKILGNPNNMYLSAPVIAFVREPSDPTGVWTVRVALKDKLRKVTVPLKTSFTLK